jgi:hypothetical protein
VAQALKARSGEHCQYLKVGTLKCGLMVSIPRVGTRDRIRRTRHPLRFMASPLSRRMAVPTVPGLCSSALLLPFCSFCLILSALVPLCLGRQEQSSPGTGSRFDFRLSIVLRALRAFLICAAISEAGADEEIYRQFLCKDYLAR